VLTELQGTSKKEWDGRRVGKLAASLHRPPMDVVVDLLTDLDGRVGMLGFGMSENNLALTLANAGVTVASDGGALAETGPLSQRKAHPRAYGTFPRVLASFVRERRALTLPDAIRKMTALPAQILGLRDRGTTEVGAAADLVVFDPATVQDRATYDKPHAYPVGISHVIVNGVLVIDDGRHTGHHPGLVLRRPPLRNDR
jgi:N-acyl-D-aspartate/D-glutamate deacylase